ncbi:MAG: ATP-binding protein [Myxococcales bacterium]|nr:ATP-binding protein [Myxococcales bacterium]
MLAGKAEISSVSSRRRIRVLIASGDPERIMLVRESLHAWPETVVCRVAVNVDDTVTHLDSHAPHIICWDTGLGPEPPAAASGVCVLLLEAEACRLPTEPSREMALPIAYVVGLQRSINREYELRRALVQLRDAHGSETQSRLLLARATDGIVVVDGSGAVVFANPAARGLLGVESTAAVHPIFEAKMPEKGKPAVYEVELASGAASSVTGTAIASMWDGQEATIVQLQPTLRPSVPPLVGPRVPEDRLRAIGRLAAGLAHEVNNPLTFVLANLESLRESHQAIRRFVRKLRVDLAHDGEISPKAFEQLIKEANLEEVIDDAAEMLTDCNKGMHRIQDIARSLGTFSRADDEQAELVDLTRVVDDACSMVFNQIRYRARLVKRSEPIPMVAAYPGRVAQALVNMLTNAVEAIDGGAYEKHRIVVSTRLENDHVIIGVSDTGVGIDDGDQARIFTPGFTTKAHDGGMGLGLSLCKRVAEEHGGRLEAHRLPDQGTRFELIIPADTGLQPVERKRESRPISEAPATRPRILIIDDDAMVLSALRRRLRRRYEPVTVLGGVEALALLAEDSSFDAIICDLMMPEVDGKSFYDTIRQRHPKLVDRVVFMSGGAFTPRLRKFAASVSNPVMQKPVTREHLESMLASIREEVKDD